MLESLSTGLNQGIHCTGTPHKLLMGWELDPMGDLRSPMGSDSASLGMRIMLMSIMSMITLLMDPIRLLIACTGIGQYLIRAMLEYARILHQLMIAR